MKELKFIFLAVYVLVLAFEYSLKFTNIAYLKKRGGKVPPEFEGEIDEDLLKKTRDYTFHRSRFGFIESIFDSALIVIFIYGGILNLYNSWMLSLNLPFIVTGILYFYILSFLSTMLSIPFSLYANFKIENAYGFNTMTWKLWLGDFFKSLLISAVLMAIVGSASLAIVQASPRFWWLWVWFFFLVFGIFFMYISPYVIEPLFNKYVPVQEEELEGKIRTLMDKLKIRISKIQIVDASKRSRHSNAYFTGIGRVKRIVLFDTLLQSMSHNEILAVLAHEGGHWKKKHVPKRIVVMELLSLAGLYIAYLILESGFLHTVFGIEPGSFFVKIILLGFVGSIVLFPFTPLGSYLSRRQEREADSFACSMIENRSDLAGALKKLSKDNLSNLYPHPFYAKFYYSHPPILERLREINSQA